MKFQKGDRIKVINDSVLGGMMCIPVATGKVFTLSSSGDIIGFQCDQTGCIEGIDDGLIELED
jgi:hypothetical protein